MRPLASLVNGYQVSQALHVAATLGVPDLLAEEPRGADDLAATTGTHGPSLYRLLRALAALGVLREENGRFALTELGDGLRSDVPGSLHGWAAFIGTPSHWTAWGDLLHSVRTGENAFRHAHGVDVWTYRASRPDESAAFDRAMAALTGTANSALLDAYDFGRFGTVVDVGGGNGALLAALLTKHPRLEGVLFDQPHVVANAAAALEAAGVADRCSVVAGSFFDGVPEGGDAYVLKAIIHDWEDEDARAILRSCRRAAGDGAVLLVVERELTGDDVAAAFSDLNMLVAPGGRERTREEFETLLAAERFRLTSSMPTESGLSVLEAEPA